MHGSPTFRSQGLAAPGEIRRNLARISETWHENRDRNSKLMRSEHQMTTNPNKFWNIEEKQTKHIEERDVDLPVQESVRWG